MEKQPTISIDTSSDWDDWSDWDNLEEDTMSEEERIKTSFADWAKRSGAELTPKSPEAEAEMYRIYSSLGANQHLAAPNLARADDEKIAQISGRLEQFADFYAQIEPEDPKIAHQVKLGFENLAIAYVSCYDEAVFTDETTDAILERARGVAQTDTPRGVGTAFGYIEDAIQVASKQRDPEVFEQYYDYFTALRQSPDDSIDGSNWNTKSSLLRSYAFNHGINAERIQAFKDNVIPAIDSGIPIYDCLSHSGNSFGTSPGEFGISDYTIHVLTSEANPRNIRDLMQIYRTIPTGDYAKFESNRRDAIALQGTLWDGRDFIHDERPGIHELLHAMVEFYDSKDNPAIHAEKTKTLQDIVNIRKDQHNRYLYTGFDGERCFDLANYDKLIEGSIRAGTRNEVEYDHIPAIDILRRLDQNTDHTKLEKPHSGNAELDQMIEKLPIFQSADGENSVQFRPATELIAKVNKTLIEKQGKTELTPDFIQAMSYVERVATYAMRSIDSADYQELGFDPGFKEICRFHELTSTNHTYSDGDFEQFWRGFTTDFGRDWPNNIHEGYKRLSHRVLSDLQSLTLDYSRKKSPRYMTDSLWSGNLNHELIGLTDER
ncbi:MAG: hypothetical protein Q4E46_00040 [Candidatus Saccharibacteria bacterium]|nr:hypothetical protein [Candidatus Saccharibacteria bacterium]